MRSPSPQGPRRAPLVTKAVALAAGAVLLAGAVLWFVAHQSGQADLNPIAGQNVLLVTIDTLRADALGCYGGPARTPALDELAAEGVRFDFAHAHAVLTLPSHTSILTGEYPFQHGVRDNAGYRVAPTTRTAATLFKRAGYETGAFVGAFPLHSRFGLNVGFDVYDDRFGETRAPTEFVMPERPATEVVALARAWLSGRGTRRWFAWVHVFDPHAPYRPPPPFDAEYAGRPYYGEVAATDAALAPLFDDLRTADRPTVVVVTGDHGESLGEHGEQTHGLFTYEATLRVPLIVAELGRGGAPHSPLPREVSHIAARHVDILPTLLAAAAQPVPSDLPGQSLLSAADRRSTAPRTSYFEAMAAMLNRGWAPLSGVLTNRDKYIDLPTAERYDLASDPGEAHNVFGQAPDRDRASIAALRDFRSALPGERRVESRNTTAQLQALGYVSGRAPIKARYSEADDPKRLVALDQAVHQAVESFTAGRPADAIRIYRNVIRQRPDMTIAYLHLAFVEWEHGASADAINTLEQAVAAGLTNQQVLSQLAAYLAETSQAAKAIQLIEPLANRPDVDPDTLNSLGIAYARAGKREDARRTFERVLRTNPESSIPLENLGVLALERHDFDTAGTLFERAVDADPHSSRAHADLGVVRLKAGDRQGAVDAWTRAVQLDPTNYDALYNLGTTLAKDGRMEEARPYLQRFVQSAPSAFYEKDRQEIAALLQSRR